MTRQGVDPSPSATTAPVGTTAATPGAAPVGTATVAPDPTTPGTTGTGAGGGAKPGNGEPKVRTRQVHPLVAKAMAKVLTPPVLATVAAALVGVQVLVGITLGWVWVLVLNVALVAAVFAGALAWRRAGIRREQGRNDRQGRREQRRGGLFTRLALRRAERRQAAHGAGPAHGGGGARGLFGRLRARMPGRRRNAHGGGSGQAAHGGGGAGQAAHGGGLRGLFGRLGSRMRNRRGGAGGGQAAHSGGVPTGGGTGGSAGGGRGLRMPGWLRRRRPGGGGGGNPGGGGGNTGGGGGGGRRNRRNRRGGRGGGGGQPHATHTTGTGERRPGFWRRQGRDFMAGWRGEHTPNPSRDRDNRHDRRDQQDHQHGRQDRQDQRRQDQGRQHGRQDQVAETNTTLTRNPKPTPVPMPPPPTNHQPRHGAPHGRNSTMAFAGNDASLQGWGRSLRKVSPVLDELATSMTPTDQALAGVVKALGTLTNTGQDDLPADPTLVAEVEAVQREAESIRADHEGLLARLRGLATRAESLPGMYANRQETDEARLAGERGGLHREMRADVSYAQKDT